MESKITVLVSQRAAVAAPAQFLALACYPGTIGVIDREPTKRNGVFLCYFPGTTSPVMWNRDAGVRLIHPGVSERRHQRCQRGN